MLTISEPIWKFFKNLDFFASYCSFSIPSVFSGERERERERGKGREMESISTGWQVISLCGIALWIVISSKLEVTQKLRSCTQPWICQRVISGTPIVIRIQVCYLRCVFLEEIWLKIVFLLYFFLGFCRNTSTDVWMHFFLGYLVLFQYLFILPFFPCFSG